LYNAVVGFGIQSQELVRPSRFSSDVIKAIRTCPIDTTRQREPDVGRAEGDVAVRAVAAGRE